MMVPSVSMMVPSSVSDPYSLNTDPAKNPNPDPDPSYFLTLSDTFFLNFIITRFSKGIYDGSKGIYDGSKGIYDGSKGIYNGSKGISDGSKGIYDGSKGIYDGSKCIQDDLNVQLTFLYSVPPETNLLVDRQFV